MKIRNRLCLVVLAVLSSTALAQDGLKIYISADMEGVVGAVTGEQLGPRRIRVRAIQAVHDQ